MTLLEKLAELEKVALSATPIGKRCPHKIYLFSESGDLVVQMRGFGSQGKPDAIPMDDNYEYYYAMRPQQTLKLLAALKEAREALENINREAVLVPPGTSPLIVTYLATFAERARQALARMEERLR